MNFKPSKTMLTKLNTEYYIYISNFSEESFRISVYIKQTEGEEVFEVPLSDPGQTLVQRGEPLFYVGRSDLHFAGTVEVEKTKELNRCYKIYKVNAQVGTELFVKRLEKMGIDIHEEVEKRDRIDSPSNSM